MLLNCQLCNWLENVLQDKEDQGRKLRAGALRKGKEKYRLI